MNDFRQMFKTICVAFAMLAFCWSANAQSACEQSLTIPASFDCGSSGNAVVASLPPGGTSLDAVEWTVDAAAAADGWTFDDANAASTTFTAGSTVTSATFTVAIDYFAIVGGIPFPNRLVCDTTITCTPPPPSAERILFVADVPIGAGDEIIVDELEGKGYVVTTIDDEVVVIADADGEDLVIISSSVNSGNIGNLFTNIDIPVITWESYLYDDLCLVTDYGVGNSCYGKLKFNDTEFSDCTGTHDVGGGSYSWGCPNSNATVVAKFYNNYNKAAIFTYEEGDGLQCGLTAPAKRAGFYFRDHTVSDYDIGFCGLDTFHKIVEWALDITGTPPPPGGCNNPTNIALNGTAYQSSTYYNSPAHLAIDGSTNGDPYGGSITRTYYETNAYWELDLGCVTDLEYIEIWNRTDYYSYMLDDYYVLVSDDPFSGTLSQLLNDPDVWHTYESTEAGRPTHVSVDRTGRYLCIMLAGCNHLSISEVEVYSCGSCSSKTNDDVVADAAVSTVSVSPTIVQNTMDVSYETTTNSTSKVAIYNLTGSLVMQQSFATENGINKQTLDASDLTPGTYILSVETDAKVETTKFVKMR